MSDYELKIDKYNINNTISVEFTVLYNRKVDLRSSSRKFFFLTPFNNI